MLKYIMIFMLYVIALGKPQATISEEAAQEMEAEQELTRRVSSKKDPKTISLSAADGNNTSMLLIRALHGSSNGFHGLSHLSNSTLTFRGDGNSENE